MVAGVDDLIRMKSARGRVKDIVHLEHVEAMREEIDRARVEGIDPQQGK